MADKIKTEEFYRLWISETDNLLEGYLYNEERKLYSTRDKFFYYCSLLERFLNNQIDEVEKIRLLSGIRGVGKTTLLSQIFYASKFIRESQKQNYPKIIEGNYKKIYMEASILSGKGIKLGEFFDFYQEINNFRFVNLKEKLLILLDEVHYDKEWGLFLKNLFDVTKGHNNILVIATGSSALKLKINPDLSRRSLLDEIYPLKFNEYALLKFNGSPLNFSAQLVNTILLSKNANELYESFQKVIPKINTCFSNLPPKTEEEFFYYGGFPFILKVRDKSLTYQLIDNVIDKLIINDILEIENFRSQTISNIKNVLNLISVSETTNLNTLSAILNLNHISLRNIIDALVQSGILVEIRSYGEGFGKVRKPIKFLFITPSLRVGILKGILPSGVKGKILEDYLALVFVRDFLKHKLFRKIDLMYDSSSGGADFILKADDKKIIFEVGFGDKNEGIRQIKTTAKNIRGFDYGIIISAGSSNIEIVEDKIIKVPLKLWLAI
ncbi:MAG: hypothetical protein CVT88_03555 [Candidatus Altiarchaeales archaeon HGW-Altiarchaeales-1]|nr:MAG: hypothetical protein CVT88_03555 [Candidatus Altiarchaeales archaeon HGW-Altiarchaeales-1]